MWNSRAKTRESPERMSPCIATGQDLVEQIENTSTLTYRVAVSTVLALLVEAQTLCEGHRHVSSSGRLRLLDNFSTKM